MEKVLAIGFDVGKPCMKRRRSATVLCARACKTMVEQHHREEANLKNGTSQEQERWSKIVLITCYEEAK